ncbi:MAG: hypothetical protein DMG83_13595 [Acidobacteria bacterium]|nr:MAG: hypothetical protein DMG83_13595 [Acidobacteriota bacterium]
MEAVGRLEGGVAHDFNNLLMIISGYAQLLDESSADPKKVAEYATRIQDASSKAATVTRQLLAFSRKQVLEPTVLDLSYVVKDLAKMLPRLLEEDVETVMELDLQLGTVRADRGQIEQVIMNLAVNARDAMLKGGRLTIATSNVALDASYYQGVVVPPGQYVLLAVSDTGIGMDAATQVHIFEPFYTTKEAGKGTGLGLATVYGIAKQSNGFIWVYSEPGKGSIFKIYFPVSMLVWIPTRAFNQPRHHPQGLRQFSWWRTRPFSAMYAECTWNPRVTPCWRLAMRRKR